jgi:hypothetical protein
MKRIPIGEIEIPTNYWSINEDDQRELCMLIIDAFITLIDKNINEEISRITVLHRMIESSIITNEEEENYEICSVLLKMQNILKES